MAGEEAVGFAGDLIVGPVVTTDWRSMDLAAHPVHCEIAGRYTRDGVGSNVLGDPREALAWSVNEISNLGIGIQAGELITTGTAAVPLEIQHGDAITCDFGVLGRVKAIARNKIRLVLSPVPPQHGARRFPQERKTTMQRVLSIALAFPGEQEPVILRGAVP